MRFGRYVEAGETNERGLIEATLTELNSDETPREGGLFVERATISVELVADPDERAKLVGVKVGDVLTIDVQKAFPNEADRASLLSTQKENLPNIQPVFQLTVNKTSNYQPAELTRSCSTGFLAMVWLPPRRNSTRK
jgi:trigger factor